MTPKEQFRYIANELYCQFPELDLRFSYQDGTQTIRFMAAAISPDIHEAELEEDPLNVLYETIFTIKELAQLYDA